MTIASLTIQEHHLNQVLKEYTSQEQKKREPRILLCGLANITADPCQKEAHLKFLSHQVLSVSKLDEKFSDSFMEALTIAQDKNLTVALIYSRIDDDVSLTAQMEVEIRRLFQLVEHSGTSARLLTVFSTSEEKLSGRLLLGDKNNLPLSLIRVVGDSIRLHYADRGKGFCSKVLQRQALAFGEALNQDLSMLRIGIVGCGGTGSAVAMLLARLKVGHIALFDRDIVEDSNLNRLHGARRADADAMKPKVEVVARSITELGLGMVVLQQIETRKR